LPRRAHFSAIVTSARVGYRKPHPKIFEAAMAATNASPREILFIGDTLEADARGAAQAGFQALLVDRRASGRHAWPAIDGLSALPAILGTRGSAQGPRSNVQSPRFMSHPEQA